MSSSVAQLSLLLSAACGGAVALIGYGLGLRAVPGTALAAALHHVAPLSGVAWRLIPLALLAAAIGSRPAGEGLLLACVGLAGIHALSMAFSPDPAAGGDEGGGQPAGRGSPVRDLAAAQVAALVMAALWGARAVPEGGVGMSFPFAVVAAAVLLGTFLGLLPARLRLGGMLGACAALAAAAFGLASAVFQAPDLWQPVAAGCAMAAVAGLVLATAAAPADEIPPPLALAITLLAGGAATLLLVRWFGVGGAALAGLGILPLALSPARGAARLAALLAAILAGRALLQWSLAQAGLGPGGLDLTQPYAFAALAAGLALAAAPGVTAPHVRGRLAAAAAVTALLALVPLAAVGVQATALPAILLGLLGAGLVIGSLRPGAEAPMPGLIAYTGSVAAVFGSRLADLGILPKPWRLVALLAAAGVIALAVAVAALSRPAPKLPEAGSREAEPEPAPAALAD
ncbi:MAG: hypothetical protein FJZ01_11925 [Candidatus Sericytochromatia bacterium]|nr:hypothetical protein [Candidatus Tanganyikabacteria bacterium]